MTRPSLTKVCLLILFMLITSVEQFTSLMRTSLGTMPNDTIRLLFARVPGIDMHAVCQPRASGATLPEESAAKTIGATVHVMSTPITSMMT